MAESGGHSYQVIRQGVQVVGMDLKLQYGGWIDSIKPPGEDFMNVDHVDDVDNVIVGENRVPCRNQCKHGEGMQSTHRKALPQWNSDRGASCCETNVLTAAPPCCRYRMGYGKFQNRLPGSGRRNLEEMEAKWHWHQGYTIEARDENWARWVVRTQGQTKTGLTHET